MIEGFARALGHFKFDDGTDGCENVRVAVGTLTHVGRNGVTRPQNADQGNTSGCSEHFRYRFDGSLLDGDADGHNGA